DDVRPDRARLRHRIPAVVDRGDLDVFVREADPHHLLDGDAVVRQQQALGHGSPRSRRTTRQKIPRPHLSTADSPALNGFSWPKSSACFARLRLAARRATKSPSLQFEAARLVVAVQALRADL